jgi:hypothetical protein
VSAIIQHLQEESNNSNQKCHNTLKNKQPSPSRYSSDVSETVEDTGGDQTSESGCEDVSGVEDRNARGNLLASVEHREQVNCTRVVRSLSDTEEEACKQEALEVLGQSSQGTDDSPEHHADTHVARRTGSVQEHVARNLSEEISDEKDRYAGLVLCGVEAEILLEVVKTSESNGVTVQVVQPVHRPQHRHDPSIKLLDERDFPGVRLLVGTRVIRLLNNRNGLEDTLIPGHLLLKHDDLILVGVAHLEGLVGDQRHTSEEMIWGKDAEKRVVDHQNLAG